MPNYCYNFIEVSGPATDLKKMIDLVKGEGKGNNLDFNKIIPYPKEYADRDKNSDRWEGFNNGGYNWCVQNWGTKWP